MNKRILSLLLCLLMLIPTLVACKDDNDKDGEEEEPDKGAYICMYLSDVVYDLDPAFSFNNKTAQKIVNLLYYPLFTLNEKGKVEKGLVDKYKIIENEEAGEYKMMITLKNTCWSDGISVDAADVIYAWKRILEVDNSNSAACMLYDIKNARKVVRGDCSIDDLGISDPEQNTLEIIFEGKIDYDQFILNLTSPALVPLREDIVAKNDDWSKKPATTVTSGPFLLRGIQYKNETDSEKKDYFDQIKLERNPYFFRNKKKDKLDKSVTPYRIMIDFSKTDEQIKEEFEKGELFYIGEIPVSLRQAFADKAVIEDEMSTHAYFLNEKALISDGGTDEAGKPTGDYIFANENVRKALSLAIDRDAIAEAVIYAKSATGLVPYKVFDANSARKQFREMAGNIISTKKDMAAAQSALSASGITASKYTFSISIREEDEVHVLIAEAVAASWRELGFNVNINLIKPIENDDKDVLVDEVDKDIRDDIFNENFHNGDFEVIAVDYIAPSPDAFSILAPFAKEFSGEAINMKTLNYEVMPHITGFDDEEYNKLIEDIFAEKDPEKRKEMLHKAEKMLLDKMPVIPVIFNRDAYVVHDDLSKMKSSYYEFRIMNKVKLKNYELHPEPKKEE